MLIPKKCQMRQIPKKQGKDHKLCTMALKHAFKFVDNQIAGRNSSF